MKETTDNKYNNVTFKPLYISIKQQRISQLLDTAVYSTNVISNQLLVFMFFLNKVFHIKLKSDCHCYNLFHNAIRANAMVL